MKIDASALVRQRVGSAGLSMAKTGVTVSRPEQDMHERVSRALALVDRLEATQGREKVHAEERAIAKARAAAPTKRPWWHLVR